MSTGSQTNSGTTRSDWKRAADSARLSARRRSRPNHTTAVTAAPDTDGSRTGNSTLRYFSAKQSLSPAGRRQYSNFAGRAGPRGPTRCSLHSSEVGHGTSVIRCCVRLAAL